MVKCRTVFLHSPLHHSPPHHDDPSSHPQTLYISSQGWERRLASSELLHDVEIWVLGDCMSPHLLQIPLQILSMLRLQTATTSLAASAANTLFRFTFNLELFELLTDTTYDLYLFAVRSNRVSRRRLLPPEYPFIRIVYGLDRPDRRRHHHCPGGDGSWQGACTNTFSSRIKAIMTLAAFRVQLWCDFCLKLLFFPPNCREHQQPVLSWIP